MNDLNRTNCTSYGTGPEKAVCFVMIVCGLGDDLHALPALAQMLADGYDLTVYCRAFHAPIFEAIGVQHVISEEQESNLGIVWVAENRHRYGRWHALKCWGGWECDSLGYSYRSQFEQFAEIAETSLPESFSWLDVLNPVRSFDRDYILFAPESAEVWRTLPREKQAEIYNELEHGETVWLTAGPGPNENVPSTSWDFFPAWRDRMTVCKTWEELSNLAYNASHVLSAENGISNLAAAYDKPLTVICGPTDPTYILGQYRKYIPDFTFHTVQGIQPEDSACRLPCYRNSGRGMFSPWKNGKLQNAMCCGRSTSPECLAAISVESILESIQVLQS